MKAPLVSLRDIAAEYDGKEVLSGVSLDVYDGDFVGITGPNGGGKTTLVKVIMGLLPYSSGSIEYADCLTVDGVRRIGYLPQQNIFDRSFPIPVVDVVVSGLQAERGFARHYTRADFALARKLLEMTGIAPLERRPIGEISGGQMQRALLCRALIAGPRLLILDEPTTYVDSHFESELFGLLRKLNSGLNVRPNNELSSNRNNIGIGNPPMAIVMVSHDVEVLSNAAKRIVRIDGTII